MNPTKILKVFLLPVNISAAATLYLLYAFIFKIGLLNPLIKLGRLWLYRPED